MSSVEHIRNRSVERTLKIEEIQVVKDTYVSPLKTKFELEISKYDYLLDGFYSVLATESIWDRIGESMAILKEYQELVAGEFYGVEFKDKS